jgi:hypothetical protein
MGLLGEMKKHIVNNQKHIQCRRKRLVSLGL